MSICTSDLYSDRIQPLHNVFSLAYTVKIKMNQDIVYSNILLYYIILLYIQFLSVTILNFDLPRISGCRGDRRDGGGCGG